MAQIGPVQLQITPNPNPTLLDFKVNYNIIFNPFDDKTGLPYRKRYVLIGVDTPAAVTGPPPDPATAAGNDTLATINFEVVSAVNGLVQPQNDTITVTRATADEDQPPIPNPDELQVRVELLPLLPVSTARNSEIVKINLP